MRQFTYINNQWTVEPLGISHGTGSGRPPSIMTNFKVRFNCISDSTQGSYDGFIRHKNIDNETDNDLINSLKKAIAKAT